MERDTAHRQAFEDHDMKKHDLSRLKLKSDDGGIRVVIETPLGSLITST